MLAPAPAPLPRPRILFVTRRFPPTIGGIETHCWELYRRLRTRTPTRLVALRRARLAHLLWFLPWSLLAASWLLGRRRVDAVYLSDGVVASLAPLLRRLSGRARFVTTIYGLELRYRQPLARWLMRRGALACDCVAVISRNTQTIALGQGIPAERLRLVYLGVEPPVLDEATAARLRERFSARHGVRLGEQRVLLNFGRQIRRKGLAEFLERGMPLLAPDIHLIIGGQGPQLPRLRELAARPELAGRVHVTGPLPDDELAMLRSSVDLFVMPNIALPDDVEGFGQTQLECMYAGTPAVAFAVDALPESVREGGYLVPPGDYAAFAARIHAYYALPPAARRAKQEEARAYVRREYSWERATSEYLALFAGSER